MARITNFIKPDGVRKLTNIKDITEKYVIMQSDIDVFHKGFMVSSCYLNEEKRVYAVILDDEVEDGTDGTFGDIILFDCTKPRAVLVDESIKYLELHQETRLILHQYINDIIEDNGKFVKGQPVFVKIKNEKLSGEILRSGRINEIFCYCVKLEQHHAVDGNTIDNPCIALEESILATSSARNGDPKTYILPRYELSPGDNKGIQGNLNSCYLDTSLFAIFTFNMFLDNLLLDNCGDDKIHELQGILRDDIINKLRKNGYVSYDIVTKFRDKLQALTPSGKFVINERDPEEFFEQLFKLITPKKYFLKTVPLNDTTNIQNCFLTQLFYQPETEQSSIKLEEMFTLSFLEFEMLIEMPPKAMILQLPRSGRDLKKFKRVKIPQKLNVTNFILSCDKKCSACSFEGMDVFFCKICSKTNKQLIYFCKEHKLNCTHEKTRMNVADVPRYIGNVTLDLASILCIEKTHYVTYVKTNNVHSKWIYFNSMEKIENGIFTPVVRDTKLQQYFDGSWPSSADDYDRDIEKVENYAFICVYKNPTMEFYTLDFNSAK